MNEVQVWEGDGIRPWPTTYEEVVERLAPIIRECNRRAMDPKGGSRVLADIVMMETGLDKLTEPLTRNLRHKVHEKTELHLTEIYKLPADKLAFQVGWIVWKEVMEPDPVIPPDLCYNCGGPLTDDHCCSDEAVEAYFATEMVMNKVLH